MKTYDVSSCNASTADHHTPTTKQHASDHAKNAYAVSGTSPTAGTRERASASPTPDTTLPKVCTRLGCKKPINGKHRLYCSEACSAATRNRRYYLTLQGRAKKQAAQSRYFQKYRYELYEKRRPRFARYLEKEIEHIHAAWDAERQHILSQRLPRSERERLFKNFGDAKAFEIAQAANVVRACHDWHPNPYDGRVGKPKYFFTQDGRAVLMDHNSSGSPEDALAWRAMRDEIMAKQSVPNGGAR